MVSKSRKLDKVNACCRHFLPPCFHALTSTRAVVKVWPNDGPATSAADGWQTACIATSSTRYSVCITARCGFFVPISGGTTTTTTTLATVDTTMLSDVFDLNRTFVERLLVFIERYNTYSDDLAEQDKTLFMMDRKLERVQRRLAQERRTNRIDLQRADARYVNENFIYRMCSEELEACSEELRDVKEELDIELRR